MLVLLAGVLMSGSAIAQTYDLLFRSNLENVTDAPATDAQAARFLTQASFGPTIAEIARLRGIGYGQWLDQQLSMPATLTRPWLEQLATNPTFSLNSNHRVDRWHIQAVFGPDQLRQRMAFALSQILVTSRWIRKLTVIDVASRQVVRQINVGRSPHGVWTLDHAPR